MASHNALDNAPTTMAPSSSRSERQSVVDVRECPDVLRYRLTNDGVDALAQLLAKEREETVRLVSERFNQRLADECGKLRADVRDEVRTEMRVFKTEIRSDMQSLRTELRSDFQTALADTRADLLKWSFVFWIGQVAAVVGLASLMA